VATSVGGNPEVVVDGETGFLVPPKDPQAMAEKILVLLRDPALAQKMGQAGRRRVEEHFSLERMVEEYEKVYGEVMTEHKST
jgi:glycosyltransferase involved in cell wall biosynthesis